MLQAFIYLFITTLYFLARNVTDFIINLFLIFLYIVP